MRRSVASGRRFNTTSSMSARVSVGRSSLGNRCGGIDNRHVESVADSMIKKDGVHGFAYEIVASERKGEVGSTSAHFCSRQVFVYPSRSSNEVYRIVVVAVNSGSYRQHVGIEYNVARR